MMSWRQVTAAQHMPATAAMLTTQPASTAGPLAKRAPGRSSVPANALDAEKMGVSDGVGLGCGKGSGVAADGGGVAGFAAGCGPATGVQLVPHRAQRTDWPGRSRASGTS